MNDPQLQPLHSAQRRLPHLHNPVRREFFLVIWSFVGLSATAGILYLIARQAASPVGVPPSFMARAFSSLAVALGMIAFICLVAVPIIGSQAAKTAVELEAMRNGHILVNWTYPRQVWEPWVKKQFTRAISQAAMTFTVCVLAIPVMLVVLEIYAGSNRLNLTARQDNQIIVLTILFVFAGISGLYLRVCISTRTRLLRNPPFTCYISDGAVYFHGIVRSYRGPYGQLVGVALVHGTPSTLGFRFYTAAGRNNYYKTFSIPVPPGQEATAEKVKKYLETSLR
jgi:hypothetical protein